MPKQIIGGVFEELLETGKKTAKQLTKMPGEIVEDAARQTGVKPDVAEQKAGDDKKIAEMKKADEEKKRREIAFTKKQLAEFQKPLPPSLPHVKQERQKEQVELAELQEKKEKELPRPVLAVKRKQTRVEIKGGAVG